MSARARLAGTRTQPRRRLIGWPTPVALITLGACAPASIAGCAGPDAATSTSVTPMTPVTVPAPTATTVPTTARATTSATAATATTLPAADATTVAPDAAEPAAPTPIEMAGAVDLTAPALPADPTTFPLVADLAAGGLVDQDGAPFLMVGDAAWSLIVQLDDAEIDEYLQSRRNAGFNTLLVELIEHHFSDDPPRDADGRDPFLVPGDLSTPNPEYFAHAHEVIARAGELGFAVLLTPAYIGYGGGVEGWYQEMVAAGPDVVREYGRFVGERFADLPNVLWVDGGDFAPPPEGLDVVRALRDGMVEAGATQLRTVHWSREISGTDLPADWIDFNTSYTAGPVYVASVEDAGVNGLPHILIEAIYEDDTREVTDQQLRAQVYEPLLTDASGSVYGHGSIWKFDDDWRDALDEPGATAMVAGAAFFEQFRWWELDSDVAAGVVVPDPGEYGSPDRITAAATPDRSIVVAYVPSERDVVVELGRSTGTVAVRWLDPSNGTFCDAEGSVDEDGTLTVAWPGRNGAGDTDWVLDVRVG